MIIITKTLQIESLYLKNTNDKIKKIKNNYIMEEIPYRLKEYFLKNGLRIFEIVTLYYDELIEYVEYSEYYLIEDKKNLGPFYGFKEKGEIIEFETQEANFIQYNKNAHMWSTVNSEKSLILKQKIELEKNIAINQQIIFFDLSKQKAFA